jgi:hypothetical protein
MDAWSIARPPHATSEHLDQQAPGAGRLVTGGKVYGYDNVRASTPGPGGGPHRSPARRVINLAQGAVVRRIFEWSAEGLRITRIARQLNAEGVPLPA